MIKKYNGKKYLKNNFIKTKYNQDIKISTDAWYVNEKQLHIEVECPFCKNHIKSSLPYLLNKKTLWSCGCQHKNDKIKIDNTYGKYSMKLIEKYKSIKKPNGRYTESEGLFECWLCHKPFRSTIASIKKGKYSCGCTKKPIKIEEFKVNQLLGNNNTKILNVDLGKDSSGSRLGKFQCSECKNEFIQTFSRVKQNVISHCGCLNKNSVKYNQGSTLGDKSIKILTPDSSKTAQGKRKAIFECPYCNKPFEHLFTKIKQNEITNCGCQANKSKPEQEIYEYILSLLNDDTHIYRNRRPLTDGKEVDIHIKSHNLMIEFNGIYWHSETMGKDKKYHLNKTNSANALGCRMIHIFEHQWLYKKDIVKSLLKKSLNITTKKVYARKCNIREVKTVEATKFINENHLQGYTASKLKLGLYYEDKLVSIMTFGKSRFNSKYEYELVRFCNDKDLTIIGGASKILKYFERLYKPKSLVSYCDKSIFDGALYEALGFEMIHESAPNYFYFNLVNKDIKVFTRQAFQKHKLKDKLPIYDDNLTEYENMRNNKYHRYWDCGNRVYLKNIKE